MDGNYISNHSLLFFMQTFAKIPDHCFSRQGLVGAFWPRSPALSHWSTMVNLCMVGEGAQRVGRSFRPGQDHLCFHLFATSAFLAHSWCETPDLVR